MSDKPHILLDAAAFCYGPISTLAAVIGQLPRDRYRLSLLASGTSEAFARSNLPDVDLIACDSEDEHDLARCHASFRSTDLFVSNTNPISARYAANAGVRTVYIDTLFWMWDAIDPALENVEAYIAQDFIGFDENKARLETDICNFHRVGPLIAPQRMAGEDKQDLAVVSFGGQQCGLADPTQTIANSRLLVRLIIGAAKDAEFTGNISFRGNDHVMQALGQEFASDRVEFAFYPHDQHLATLRTAKLQFLSPGLTGIFEAMDNCVPSFFLLGQNYSQELQSSSIKADAHYSSVFPGIIHWRDIYSDQVVERYLPEEEGVRKIHALWERFGGDHAVQSRYRGEMAKAFLDPPQQDQSKVDIVSGARETAQLVAQIADFRVSGSNTVSGMIEEPAE